MAHCTHKSLIGSQPVSQLPAGNLTKKPASTPTRGQRRSKVLLLEGDVSKLQLLSSSGVKHGASTVTASDAVLENRGGREKRFRKTNRL